LKINWQNCVMLRADQAFRFQIGPT